ncbi:MAG: acryloyl-CoA reductase, partial [Methanobacteriota archaeon]
MGKKFQALVVEEQPDGTFSRSIRERDTDSLPPGDVLIRVEYSSLNYKDALSASGHKGVTRNYPHTPGIDAAGYVEESTDRRFREGDPVLVTGYDLGQNTSGGFGQYIRVPADWVIPISGKLTPETAMFYGTAGFTAALGVHKVITHGIRPENGRFLVTGASGGVGSLGVALFAHLGYDVIASTGKENAHEMLKNLGAAEIWSREQVQADEQKHLLPGRWSAALDTVGGNTLSTVIRGTKLHGVVTCCGNVSDVFFKASIFPFILRGIELVGIDSANQDRPIREILWTHLGSDWFVEKIKDIVTIVSLEALEEKIQQILNGQ